MLSSMSVDSRYSSLVDGIMTVEQKPLKQLQTKVAEIQHQKSSYAALKSDASNYHDLVKTLAKPEDFRCFIVNDDFDGELNVTPDGNATSGYYSIDVTQTALEGKKSSIGFTDKDASIGETGTIRITVNSSSFDIGITSLNDNLQEIKESINNSSDNDLVKAGIINVDDGIGGIESRLVLTTVNTGADQDIQVSDVSGSIASILDISTAVQTPRDATIVLDGFNISSSSNVLVDTIEGLTIELFSTTSASKKFNVVEDRNQMTQRINDFVDEQNSMTKRLLNINENSSLSIKNELHHIIHDITGKTGKFKVLTDIGITINPKTSLYEIDADKLSDVVKEDYDEVQKLFSEKNVGIAVKLESYLKALINDEGSIGLTDKTLDSKLIATNKKIDRENTRLESTEAALRKRYAALEKNVSRMENTQSYLKDQMKSIGNIRSKNNE